MAQAVFEHLTLSLPSSSPRIRADSAGMTAYHEDEPPDLRTLATLQEHGITDFEHGARYFVNSDFDEFDYILAMDKENLESLTGRARRLKSSKGAKDAHICLFGDYDHDRKEDRMNGEEIVDPYYGADTGFETAFQQCVRFSKGWLREVLGVEVELSSNGITKVIESQQVSDNA